jgi:hypothetical protein
VNEAGAFASDDVRVMRIEQTPPRGDHRRVSPHRQTRRTHTLSMLASATTPMITTSPSSRRPWLAPWPRARRTALGHVPAHARVMVSGEAGA